MELEFEGIVLDGETVCKVALLEFKLAVALLGLAVMLLLTVDSTLLVLDVKAGKKKKIKV